MATMMPARAQGGTTPAGATLLGWSVKENAATPAPASVRITSGSQTIAYISLAASEAKSMWYGPQGIKTGDSFGYALDSGSASVIFHYV